ncbi:MAG: M23 family metallopeptidase [archaeon]|nr:M23 family metallopeptidase [Candidatus Micrarchaeota archaeon]
MKKNWIDFGIAVTAIAFILLVYSFIPQQQDQYSADYNNDSKIPKRIIESHNLLPVNSIDPLYFQATEEECNSVDECLARIDARFLEDLFGESIKIAITPGSSGEEIPPETVASEFAWPTNDPNHTVTSCYGEKRTLTDISGRVKSSTTHAVDLRAREGTPVYAIADGRVIEVSNNAGDCGKKILYLLSNDQGAIRYCHLSELLVTAGQGVSKGQVIGKAGSTGFSTAAHLDVKWYPDYPASLGSADFLCLMTEQGYTFKEGVSCPVNDSCPVSYT